MRSATVYNRGSPRYLANIARFISQTFHKNLNIDQSCSDSHHSSHIYTQNTSSSNQAPKTRDTQLRLVTAYSGYSKDYLNYINNAGKSGLHFLNRKKGVIGDDAWFISSLRCSDVLGVADGVGGWRDIGVDPSKFSSNLMRTCKRIVEQELAGTNNLKRKMPIEILTASYQALLENKNQALIGSSTACIVLFNKESKLLHSANLGDSGFVIIRNNKIGNALWLSKTTNGLILIVK